MSILQKSVRSLAVMKKDFFLKGREICIKYLMSRFLRNKVSWRKNISKQPMRCKAFF